MPTPIIDLQRRLTLVGALRAGGEKPERGVGRKLESFRLTSARKQLVEQAAQLYGGEVTPWRSPVGDEWQVYTEAEEIPVLVMPGYSLRQSYELWEGATKRTRLCDGVDEELTGGPCICEAEGVDKCDLYTRLIVALPELDTVLGWRLITRGANAGHELPTMLALIEAQGRGATFVPARIRIDERRGVKDGQVVRFVVPTLDLGVGYLQLAAKEAPPALESGAVGVGYETATRRSPSVDEALGAISAPRSGPASGSRHAAPLPDVEPRHQPAPFAPAETEIVGTEHVSADHDPASYEESRQTKLATDPQRDKLNVLVGQLRDAGHITTDVVYAAVGERLRGLPGIDLAAQVGGIDAGGELHWSPLRDTLTRPEASQLIDWLETKERQVDEAKAATG